MEPIDEIEPELSERLRLLTDDTFDDWRQALLEKSFDDYDEDNMGHESDPYEDDDADEYYENYDDDEADYYEDDENEDWDNWGDALETAESNPEAPISDPIPPEQQMMTGTNPAVYADQQAKYPNEYGSRADPDHSDIQVEQPEDGSETKVEPIPEYDPWVAEPVYMGDESDPYQDDDDDEYYENYDDDDADYYDDDENEDDYEAKVRPSICHLYNAHVYCNYNSKFSANFLKSNVHQIRPDFL